MRKGSMIFLISFCAYLGLMIILSIVIKDSNIIPKCTFAVTVSSVFFSLADIIKSKYNIEENEIYLNIDVIKRTNELTEILKERILKKHGKKARILVDNISKSLADDETDNLLEILSKRCINEEDKKMLMHYCSKLDSKFQKDYIELIMERCKFDSEEITEIFENDENDEKDERLCDNILGEIQKKYRKVYALQVIGIFVLLILLTTDGFNFNKYYYINNLSTLIAFLMLMMNFLVNEVYREKDIKILKDHVNKLNEGLNEYRSR